MKIVDIGSPNPFRLPNFLPISMRANFEDIKTDTKAKINEIAKEYSYPSVPIRGRKVIAIDISRTKAIDRMTLSEKNISLKYID